MVEASANATLDVRERIDRIGIDAVGLESHGRPSPAALTH